MKFSVTFKDPDGPHECFQEAAEAAIDATNLDEDEHEAAVEIRLEKLKEFAGKWLDCGEYVTIEFDTEAGTAVVVPQE